MGVGHHPPPMIEIDGAGGGGQILRSALSLSMVTGHPFRLTNVRGGRDDPGLRPQHVAGVETAARLCNATVAGAEPRGDQLVFEPGPIDGDISLEIDIGTAGSVTLLFDILLPIAATPGLEGPVTVTAMGGTDVKWSPTIGFLTRVKLPVLGRFGFEVTATTAATGFYPKGGGEATLRVRPSDPHPFALTERGPFEIVEIYSKAAAGLADSEVAERQARAAAERLRGNDRPVTIAAVESVETASLGSSVLLRARYRGSLTGFDALGERGKPAEAVGEEAAERFLAFDRGPGAVDRYLADQLLVPLALAGGEVRIPTVTPHVETNRETIAAFGYDLALRRHPDGTATVKAPP